MDELRKVTFEAFVVLCCLSVVGLIITIAFLFFNVYQRSTRWVIDNSIPISTDYLRIVNLIIIYYFNNSSILYLKVWISRFLNLYLNICIILDNETSWNVLFRLWHVLIYMLIKCIRDRVVCGVTSKHTYKAIGLA